MSKLVKSVSAEERKFLRKPFFGGLQHCMRQ